MRWADVVYGEEFWPYGFLSRRTGCYSINSINMMTILEDRSDCVVNISMICIFLKTFTPPLPILASLKRFSIFCISTWMNRLEAFKIFSFWKKFGAYWMQHKTNERTLRRMHKYKKLVGVVKRRNLECFLHFIQSQKYSLLPKIIQR